MVNRTCFRCSSESGSRPGRIRSRSRPVRALVTPWLVGLVALGPLGSAHAGVLEIYETAELEEFQYRRLVDYAEAAGYALDANRSLGHAMQSGLRDMPADNCNSDFRPTPDAVE